MIFLFLTKKYLQMERLINKITNQQTQIPKPFEDTSPKLQWINTGGGSFRTKNRIIKPGQVFLATINEIPIAFRDTLKLVDEIKGGATPEQRVEQEEKKQLADANAKVVQYEIKPRGKSTYLFDVVGTNGKVVNEKGLKKPDAEALKASLE